MWKGYPPWKGFGSLGLAWTLGAPWIGGIFRLGFDAQDGVYTVGNSVAGGLSGSTARIVGVQDDGADGILTLDRITGPFLDNEVIYESAISNVYTSNFSAGVDGWGVSGGVVAGNIDEISGENDCLRLTINAANSGHLLSKGNLLTVGNHDRLRIKIYFPSTNSHLNCFRIYDSTAWLIDTNYTVDSWVGIDTIFTVKGVHLYVYSMLDNITTYQDPGGNDVIYIKDIILNNYTNAALVNGVLY